MHSQSVDQWTHGHVFLGSGHAQNERRTWWVVGITATMMLVEIVGGSAFGSMALLADGWHMATHAAALGIAGLAYFSARQHAHNPRFAFGTGKFGELAAFTSAIILGLIAVQIAYESLVRLLQPAPIAYTEAIVIAVLGLAVNLVCAWVLGGHGHTHAHGPAHEERDRHAPHEHRQRGNHHHRDNNLTAAYVHVLADAATSVLAIVALLVAMTAGWQWADPAVGLLGSGVIASWAYGLVRESAAVLLDVAADHDLEAAIRGRLETEGDRITDLHVWQVGPGHHAAIVSIVSDHPLAPSGYKERLVGLARLSHVTVEVERCPHQPQAGLNSD